MQVQDRAESSFGDRLRQQRLAAGFTQAALAERAGVAERTIQDLERGLAHPRRQTVNRLVSALGQLPEVRAQLEAAISGPRRHPGLTTRPRRRGERPVARDKAVGYSAHVALAARPHNLPLQTTLLLGRNRGVGAVRSLLLRDHVRLVTLTGAGGSGKTRLGLQVAADLLDRFESGAFFVDLAPISDPSLVIPTIAQVLGVQVAVGRPLIDALVDSLRGRQLLLVLDNFEHVLAAAMGVDTLLRACPRLCILVTSRAALQLRGEHEYPVPPLALPDSRRALTTEELSQYGAVALFIERATAIKPDFVVTDTNAPAVVEICARLDGLPLAIELAATRIRLLNPQAMLARLERRLPMLTGGARDLPARQRTLRSTIGWSYDLLDEGERTLFRRLAIFVGGCTLEAAETVCDADGDLGIDMLDGVASLVSKSLLREFGQEDEPRFGMLETIRDYGQELLEAGRELDDLRRRHVEYYLTFAERLHPRFEGHFNAAWSALLEREHDNLRAALTWSQQVAADLEAGPRLAGALWQFWWHHGHLREGREWLERMLSERAGPAVRARMLAGAGGLASYLSDLSDYSRAATYLEAARALWQQIGDQRGVAWTLHRLGWVVSSAKLKSPHGASESPRQLTP
jgi:predicted ATPase/transcriptional regulator with XRE-family HTH domain